MTEQLLGSTAGAILSLIFSFTPKLKDKYQALRPDQQRLVMIGLLFICAVGYFVAACAGRYAGISCDVNGVWKALEVWLFAVIGSQSVYMITPKGRRSRGGR